MSELPDDGLEPVTFHAPRGIRDRLLALAHERGRTLDDVVTVLVEELLEEDEYFKSLLTEGEPFQASPNRGAHAGPDDASERYPEYQHLSRADPA